MQRVGHLVEELQRFNPNARVVPEIDFQGVSPATECQVGVVGVSGNRIQTALTERDNFEERCDELIDGLERIKEETEKTNPDMELIKETLTDLEI